MSGIVKTGQVELSRPATQNNHAVRLGQIPGLLAASGDLGIDYQSDEYFFVTPPYSAVVDLSSRINIINTGFTGTADADGELIFTNQNERGTKYTNGTIAVVTNVNSGDYKIKIENSTNSTLLLALKERQTVWLIFNNNPAVGWEVFNRIPLPIQEAVADVDDSAMPASISSSYEQSEIEGLKATLESTIQQLEALRDRFTAANGNGLIQDA